MNEWGVRKEQEVVTTWRGVELLDVGVRGNCWAVTAADSPDANLPALLQAYAVEHEAYRAARHALTLSIESQKRAAARSLRGVSQRQSEATRKRKEARRLAAELRRRHPKKSVSFLANRVHDTAPALGSERTIRRFIADI